MNYSRIEIEEPNKNLLANVVFSPEANHSNNLSVQPEDDAFYALAISTWDTEGGATLSEIQN